MKSLTRSLIAVALALLLIASPTLARAQDSGPGCQGLSAADCQLLTDAKMAMHALTSYSIPAWSGNFYLAAEGETAFGGASGSAIIALPAELTALRDAFMSAETVTPAMLLAFLGEIDSATIQTILDQLLLSVVVDSFELSAPGESVTASGALLVKDSTVYLNLPAPSAENTWFAEVIELTETDLAEIDVALAELRVALLDEEMAEAFDAAGALVVMQQDLAAFLQKHITTTRLSDDTLEGQPTAVFSTAFNLKSLLSDPALPALLLEAAQNLAAQNPEMDEITVNQAQLQLILLALNLMITEGTVTSSQWIGLADGYPHRATLDVVLNIDPSLFADEDAEPADPVVFSASFAVDLAGFNAVTPDLIVTPSTYYPGDELDNFLAGTPEQVEGVLAVGDTISQTLPFDGGTQIFALPLEAGQTVTLTLESDSYPYLNVYNPAAFLVETLSTFSGEPLVFTADSAGVYFLTVEGFALSYELSVTAE